MLNDFIALKQNRFESAVRQLFPSSASRSPRREISKSSVLAHQYPELSILVAEVGRRRAVCGREWTQSSV